MTAGALWWFFSTEKSQLHTEGERRRSALLAVCQVDIVLQYKSFVDNYSKAFLDGALPNLSGVAEIDEFAVFPLLYLHTFQKVRMSHGLLADSVDTSLSTLLYSCKTYTVLSEVHDQ